MNDAILTGSEATAAIEGLGWRHLLECLTAAVAVDGLEDACQAAALAARTAGRRYEGHLRVRAGAERLELTLQDPHQLRVTERDVELARSITETLHHNGYEAVPHPAHHPEQHAVQSLQIAIDAMDIAAVRPFWQAVLGYDAVTAPEAGYADLADPADGGPSLWFQQMDEPRTQRNRIHLDVVVPHDEAEARVEAALAAGGRLVNGEHARAFWVLADVEGNEACVCTWQDRD